ncbi:DUF3429 domain-containing protein [Pikeienuella sp. HZG-20]|uniref:DUF3429 domain-containing protein n=1 Tax=Paludibacillus litoralis TaxID=3133267 RepID=UPI0030EEE0BD
MIAAIPRPALALGLLGLSPFVYGAAAAHWRGLEIAYAPPLMIMEVYGPVIFAYMGGVFWGFACGANRAGGRAGWRWLGLAAAPALFIFLALFIAPGEAVPILLFAFPALLPIDFVFWRARLAPRWWLSLRFVLTALVTGCLWVAAEGAGFAL